MAGRPKLPDDIRKVRLQVHVEPRIHKIAEMVKTRTGVSISEAVAGMALHGARAYVEKMLPPAKPTHAAPTDPTPRQETSE